MIKILDETDKQELQENIESVNRSSVKTVNGQTPLNGNVVVSATMEQPTIVDTVEEMTDTSKQYVLQSTGTLWVYKESTAKETSTENITEGFTEGARWGSDGNVTSGASYSSYVCTPKIDISKYNTPFTLHLKGLPFYPLETVTYNQCCTWTADGSFMRLQFNQNNGQWYGSLSQNSTTVVIGDDQTIELSFTPPPKRKDETEIAHIAFCTIGTSAEANVYITYEQEVTKQQWTDTGISYGAGGIDPETLAKISELNNEGSDPTTIKLLPKPVLDFYNTSAYPDNDYTASHLQKVTYPCRADIPVPFTVKWSHNENAMRTTVAVDTKAITSNNAYTLKTYEVTGLDNYPLYNLLPNTTYYYKVTHVLPDGSLLEAKSGSFTTSNESVRLLYIDGTQNVRDLGGWSGLDGKKVKYGKLFRGAAFSDSSYPGLMLTGKGRLALAELKIQAELNLGAVDSRTEIAQNCSYKKVGYTNYATAITDSNARINFKTILEYIVSCLNGTLAESGLSTVERNVYFHCQGGCDRTGTLSFILLGLLGVSESDLAKEYELSSFSDVGYGRLRTTTKAANTYDYVGMVEALKTYSGDTITDKFYDFATTGCEISSDTITSFRNLMLE